MSWVKLDDGCTEHRKQLAAGAAACWLWVCGLAYANRQKARDGFIPAAKVAVLYPMPGAMRQAARLVEVGLWERVEGGFRVHDYHEFQPDAAKAQALSEARSRAGRAGGTRSGEARRLASNEATVKQLASPLLEAKRTPDPDPDPGDHTHTPQPPTGSTAPPDPDRAAVLAELARYPSLARHDPERLADVVQTVRIAKPVPLPLVAAAIGECAARVAGEPGIDTAAVADTLRRFVQRADSARSREPRAGPAKRLVQHDSAPQPWTEKLEF